MSKIKSAPACLTGSVGSLPLVSICQDGATHLLHTVTPAPIRLVAHTDSIKEKLDKYKDAKIIVTVCGELSWGPECNLFDVILVEVGTDFKDKAPKIMGDLDPWPLFTDSII